MNALITFRKIYNILSNNKQLRCSFCMPTNPFPAQENKTNKQTNPARGVT